MAVALQSHFGVDPSNHPSWTGMIGNKFITEFTGGTGTNSYKTQFPVSFVVDSPPIPEQYRAERTLTAAQDYEIDVPIDDLLIVFLDL